MNRELFTEIAGMLAEVTGEEGVAPDATLDGDLGLDSLDLIDFAGRLHDRYGVDLLGYAATLDIDELIALTAADVARLVAA